MLYNLNIDKKERKKAFDICKKCLKPFFISLKVSAITANGREKEVVFQRALVVFILRKEKYKFTQIAGFLNKHHTTILHLFYQYPKYYGTTSSGKLRKEFRQIINKLNKLFFEVNMKKRLKNYNFEIRQLKKKIAFYTREKQIIKNN